MTYPLSFVTKRERSFGLRVVMYLGGGLAYDILIEEVFIFLKDGVRIYVLFFSLF